MSGVQQSRLVPVRRGRHRVALAVSLAVLAGSLGFAPGSAAGPTGSGDSMVTGDGAVSPAAVPQCRAYVVNQADGTVSVINTVDYVVVGTIVVGDTPSRVVVTPDGATAYVTNVMDDTVSVIDTASQTVTDTVPVGDNPSGAAVSPDGATTYVTNSRDGSVSLIDTATNNVTGTVPVGSGPVAIAIAPDGSTGYVINQFGTSMAVIDTATNAVTDTINVGSGPADVAVTPDGARVYVPNSGSNTVSVIDTATNAPAGLIAVVNSPAGVAVAPDGATVYVTSLNGDTVSVIDTFTNAVTDTITVGISPLGVAFSPDGANAIVANAGSNSITVIDTVRARTLTRAVGDTPTWVAVGPCGAPDGPAAPGVAVTGAGSVRATVAGASSGDAPTSFEVATVPDRRLCSVSGASGSCDISGLDERTVYRVSTVARNTGGSSPRSSVSVSVTPGSGDAARAASQFRDVAAGEFYARGVDMLFQHGITEGRGSPNVFAPGEVVTRAQMATFLWRMAGEPTTPSCSFVDQGSIPSWASVATCWMKANGYTKNDPYGPDGSVDRAQMAAFLFRIWGPADGVYRQSCGFNDEGEIPSWARGASCWLKDNSITVGFGGPTRYAPQVAVDRGQMATFLYRLGGNIEDRWLVVI